MLSNLFGSHCLKVRNIIFECLECMLEYKESWEQEQESILLKSTPTLQEFTNLSEKFDCKLDISRLKYFISHF